MNEIVNTFLLVGDKFMPEMHLKQPGFTYSGCAPFTKNREIIEKFMQTGNTDLIYKNELDKSCFQHDMAYSKSKYDGYQRGLASIVYKFFDKKSSGNGVNKPNYQLANELQKPIIKKFKKTKVYSSFGDNISGVDLADMRSLSKYNNGIKYLFCAIDLFSKYAWVFLLKEKIKKGLVLLMHFKK